MNNKIDSFLNDIISGNKESANNTLNDIMLSKISDAIEFEKIQVANKIFNGSDNTDQE